jgi:D-alanyl-D-alanine carboxypeptidase
LNRNFLFKGSGGASPLGGDPNSKPSSGKGKYMLLAAVLLVIVGVHAVALIFFMRKKEPEAPKPPETAQTDQAAPAGGPLKPGAPVLPGQPKKLSAGKPVNPRFGEPFDYSGAVQGDLKSPDSSSVKTGILVDLGTRKVLWAKHPKESAPIASMTKMMTVLLSFEAMEKRGDVNLDSEVKVSRTAAKMGGSQVYLDTKESFSLGELLKSVCIKSANDSCQLVGEFMNNGDSAGFVNDMNKRAKELKMNSTKFFNCHGLPGSTASEDNMSSAEDMAILSERLLEYPQVVEWASSWSAPFRKEGEKGYLLMTNHNHLVKDCSGVDGMKTGWIQRSGFCTTITCKRGDRRLVAVVTGCPDRKSRDAFVSKLLDWGYRNDGSAPAKTAVAAAPGKTDAKAASSAAPEGSAKPAKKPKKSAAKTDAAKKADASKSEQ